MEPTKPPTTIKSKMMLKRNPSMWTVPPTKRRMSLRKYLATPRTNDCNRLDINQVTKCVFLATLSLKPVPQIFETTGTNTTALVKTEEDDIKTENNNTLRTTTSYEFYKYNNNNTIAKKIELINKSNRKSRKSLDKLMIKKTTVLSSSLKNSTKCNKRQVVLLETNNKVEILSIIKKELSETTNTAGIQESSSSSATPVALETACSSISNINNDTIDMKSIDGTDETKSQSADDGESCKDEKIDEVIVSDTIQVASLQPEITISEEALSSNQKQDDSNNVTPSLSNTDNTSISSPTSLLLVVDPPEVSSLPLITVSDPVQHVQLAVAASLVDDNEPSSSPPDDDKLLSMEFMKTEQVWLSTSLGVVTTTSSSPVVIESLHQQTLNLLESSPLPPPTTPVTKPEVANDDDDDTDGALQRIKANKELDQSAIFNFRLDDDMYLVPPDGGGGYISHRHRLHHHPVEEMLNNSNNNDVDENKAVLLQYDAKQKKLRKRTPQCKICSQIFTSYIKLKKHKLEHDGEKPYLCLKCGMNHTTLEQLIAHLRIHQGKNPYLCKKCGKGFKSFKSLSKHEPVHVLRKLVYTKKMFKCEVCEKEFRKLCDLERHTRVHTGEKPSVCNICNRRFQQAHNLNKHLLIHTQEKPFVCDICNKRFGRNDVLNRHLLTHAVDKPNHCEYCFKSFIRSTQLLGHKAKYHAAEIFKHDSIEQIY